MSNPPAFDPGGVLGAPTHEADDVADLWRSYGWTVTEAADLQPPAGLVLLRIEDE